MMISWGPVSACGTVVSTACCTHAASIALRVLATSTLWLTRRVIGEVVPRPASLASARSSTGRLSGARAESTSTTCLCFGDSLALGPADAARSIIVRLTMPTRCLTAAGTIAPSVIPIGEQ